MIVFSSQPQIVPQEKYSHEYVREILKKKAKSGRIKVFDLLMGKGVLARVAKQWGHASNGVDMNENKRTFAIELII